MLKIITAFSFAHFNASMISFIFCLFYILVIFVCSCLVVCSFET